MEPVTTTYLSRAELWLGISTLMYFLMNGAQLFETLVLVPKWTHSPPAHFGLLLDGPGAGLKNFWIVCHSLHEVTFILAIIFCWKIDPVRNWLLLLFLVHLAVRVWTLTYFAPHIMAFQKIAADPSPVADLAARTARWQALNYVRVAIFLAVSIGLVPLCIRLWSIRH